MISTRSVIWTQVFLAAVTLLAARADRGLAPKSLYPALVPIVWVAYLSIPLLPLTVFVILCKSTSGVLETVVTFITTVALAVTTFFCFLPLVQ